MHFALENQHAVNRPDTDAIIIPMTVLVCAALAIFLAGAVVAARRLAKIPTIRLVSTKQQPELTLHKGQTWHLFNSHIWFQQSMRLSRPLPPAGNLLLIVRIGQPTIQIFVGGVWHSAQTLPPFQ